MIPAELPQYPRQKVGTDLLTFRELPTYLVIVDYFSRYSDSTKTTFHDIQSTEKFSRFGVPETVISDNGPHWSLHNVLRHTISVMYVSDQLISTWESLKEFRDNNLTFKNRQKRDYDRQHR